jgi:hypothetical protein
MASTALCNILNGMASCCVVIFKGEKGKLCWGNSSLLKKNLIDLRQYFYYIYKITNRCWLILTGFQMQWPTRLILTMGKLTVLVNRFKRCQYSGLWLSLVYFSQLGKSWMFLTKILNWSHILYLPLQFPYTSLFLKSFNSCENVWH